PGRISTHLIAGLGESERDLVEATAFFIQNRVTVGLFAFTPVPGTRLAHQPPPERSSYRRLQIARYLLAEGLASREDLGFDGRGRLVRIEVPPEVWARVQGEAAGEPFGEPFRTSGCPGCNRPHYNERPGQVPYNYPRPLTPAEAAAAWAEAGLEIAVRGRSGGR
ncbi:MAG: radical SAM protein, partial [Bacillota bacterium]|nr:radical SAM protein [Bacillota bacterium]